jgi:hypothetical protein
MHCLTEKNFAVLLLAIVAITSMFLINDPDNIIIQVITAIAAFITGERVGASLTRKDDTPEGK